MDRFWSVNNWPNEPFFWIVVALIAYATIKDIYDEWSAGLIDYHWSWPVMKHFVETPQPASGSEAELGAADGDAVEAEAAMFIKTKCEVGKLFAARLSDPTEDRAAQLAHYQHVRDECISRADKIDDEFYRAFAIRQIIQMCVAAEDIVVAKALLGAVRDDSLREEIFESAPVLRP
jgi:hypothetical protein